MKKIVLFDMDGTLTPARKSMKIDILNSLKNLSNAGFEIGIVTGSDFDYLKEQCEILFSSDLKEKIHWLPCNGTKYFKLGIKETSIHEINMIEELGQKNYNNLVNFCITSQLKLINEHPDLPLTGNFFQYRGSMLNWCPIGRAAESKQRQIWEHLDKENRIRLPLLDFARKVFSNSGLENLIINLGGETSFDIYPRGWDKTYALKHFPEYKIYFVGDRCKPNGNDHSIYEVCKPYSWETSGPEKTINIIDSIITEEIR